MRVRGRIRAGTAGRPGVRGLFVLGPLVLCLTAVPAAILPAPSAAAASGSQCVALVVDRAPGSYGTNCVTWSAGTTGLQVLQRAGHSVQFRQDGLICKIDGYPGGTCSADATHYWSYWHRAPGSSTWTYSSAGPASYQPAAGSTEGWAYQNGASRQPANVSFPTICPPPRTTAARTTTPPPPPRTSQRATTTAPPPVVTAPVRTRTSSPTTAARSTASAGPATHSPPPRRTTTAPRSESPTGTPTSAPPDTPSTTPVAAVSADEPPAASAGSRTGLIVGLLLVVAIIVATLWFARSRRRTT